MNTQVIKVRTQEDFAAAAMESSLALKGGKVVAFATETVYGVGAVASDRAALERLRDLKDRPARPFSVHMGQPGDAARYVRDIPPQANRLMRRAWPGPVTILLQVAGRLADEKYQAAGLYDLLCDGDVIGLRCPDVTVTNGMLSSVPWPVVASSANLAGEPSPHNAQEVLKSLDGKIDLLVDSGPTLYGKDSTIVHIGADGMTVVRQGVYDEATVRRMAGLRLLFVCSGNTCRSPMAAGIASKMLADMYKCTVPELERYGVQVESAGTSACAGMSASSHAIKAAADFGSDISGHISQRLTIELINSADLVFCMTGSHLLEAEYMAPMEKHKIDKLAMEGDISDPIGGGAELYAEIAKQIADSLEYRLKKGLI